MSTPPLPAAGQIDLRDYLAALRLRKWSILGITLVCALLASLYVRSQTPKYTASASVLVTNPLAVIQGLNQTAQPNMSTEQALVSSTDVARCASLLIKNPTANPTAACAPNVLAGTAIPTKLLNGLHVSSSTTTTVLQISYTSPSPALAAQAAQAFAESYVYIKTFDATQAVNAQRDPLLTQQKNLMTQIATKNAQYAHLLATGSPNAAAVGQYITNVLSPQLQQVNAQLANLDPTKIVPPTMVSSASVPTSPSSPKGGIDIAAGTLLGLVLGIVVAFVRDILSDDLRGRSDLEERIGAPVLAAIPGVATWRRKQDARLVVTQDPKSPAAEAYRTLRTSVLFHASQYDAHSILITGAGAGEGKSTTAANLAAVIAESGRRVILVSGDLRKPRVHEFFKLPNVVGLSSVLSRSAKLEEALQKTGIANLRVLAGGPVPARPTELLQSEQMTQLLAELRTMCDVVIIDSAPMLLLADAQVLASRVDAVLFVADPGITRRSMVLRSRETFEQVAAPLMGAVLNRYDPKKDRGSAGYGGYGYRGYGVYGEPVATEPAEWGGARRSPALPQPSENGHEPSSVPGTTVAPESP